MRCSKVCAASQKQREDSVGTERYRIHPYVPPSIPLSACPSVCFSVRPSLLPTFHDLPKHPDEWRGWPRRCRHQHSSSRPAAWRGRPRHCRHMRHSSPLTPSLSPPSCYIPMYAPCGPCILVHPLTTFVTNPHVSLRALSCLVTHSRASSRTLVSLHTLACLFTPSRASSRTLVSLHTLSCLFTPSRASSHPLISLYTLIPRHDPSCTPC